MEYKFSEIEEQIKKFWSDKNIYQVGDAECGKPKYYVLDMFPYPSGAGLHVGHPLGYIASDIYSRYKRMKGFNVLHPMGYDSFGLPAEQYAIQTGQHPATTTKINIDGGTDDNGKIIEGYRKQLDKMGFSFDWSREVRTSDPEFYKWTQWIFIQLFNSWYNNSTDKAENISSLEKIFAAEGNANVKAAHAEVKIFSADEWKKFSGSEQQEILMQYRLAFLSEAYVNWCPALGTVLANDEVKDGVSERGGYPVERKLMKQWMLRITAYAERLLSGLNDLLWSESIKEAQRNWIGRSEGASVKFEIAEAHSPLLRRGAGGEDEITTEEKSPGYLTGNTTIASELLKFGKENRKNPTEAEEFLWQNLRNRKLDDKFRRQHPINNFIADFVCLEKKLIVELDGEQHKENKEYDLLRTQILVGLGYRVIRFWNEDVFKKTDKVLGIIKDELNFLATVLTLNPSPKEREIVAPNFSIGVFTTRPDTIFGVTFLTLAPEHELINQITLDSHKKEVEEYVLYAKNRSERERMTEVKKITGVFTGAYAIHPFTGKQIQVWIGEYVLAGYGTGAVMGVPGHDSRDYGFAKHFNLEIIEVVSGGDILKEAFEGEGKNINSTFLDGLKTSDAKKKVIDEIEKNKIGKRKINFKLRDAVFGRQRYWGEPIPIYYDENNIPRVVDENDLPIRLPEVDKYLPTETGEPPLANAKNWKYFPPLLRRGEGGEDDGEEETPRYLTGNTKIASELLKFGKENRKSPTEAEELLWQNLRNRKLDDKFRRQHPIDNFIADFVCLEKKLIVELDGEQHKEKKEYDLLRTQILNELGFKVIRFWNDEVQKNIHEVLVKIKSELKLRAEVLTPNPSPKERGTVGFPLEFNTMPGWAGSSWYLFRYMDPHNKNAFAGKDKLDYWKQVDFYIGGNEHATGHLMYFRFWTKFLKDLGLVDIEEPAKRLVNQGMIQGRSAKIYRFNFEKGNPEVPPIYVSADYARDAINRDENYLNELENIIYKIFPNIDRPKIIHTAPQNFSSHYVDISFVEDEELLTEELLEKGNIDKRAFFIKNNSGQFKILREVEKMSKSKYNVVNPDDIIEKYGADCFRMYEMFLGPVEMSKPWDTKGIDGVSRFLRKLWKLFYSDDGKWLVTNEAPTNDELKILHKTIKKVEDDIEKLSYNTSVSAFMICVNELTDLKCHKAEVLKDLLLILSPFAPFTTEFLWQELLVKTPTTAVGDSIVTSEFPKVREELLVENSFEYPIAINGKTKTKITFALDKEISTIEKEVLDMEILKKYFEGRAPKKIIVVKGKMINVVV